MSKQKQEPTYWANLPAEVRYSKMISPMEKIMYAEITALSSKTGHCWASNGYFAELYDVQPTTVSEWINNLKRQGFISTRGSESKNRVISLQNILRKKPKTPSEKAEGQPSGKAEHNNTSINNKNNNTEAMPRDPLFKTKDYLLEVMKQSKGRNHARYFSAYFLVRKGLTFNSKEATEVALKRHYRAGKELGYFVSDPNKLSDAFDRAESLVVQGERVNWSLDTVLKLLSK